MVAGCGFHHLHCIDVELIVHHLIFLKCVNFLGTLDSWLDPVKTFCKSVEKRTICHLEIPNGCIDRDGVGRDPCEDTVLNCQPVVPLFDKRITEFN